MCAQPFDYHTHTVFSDGNNTAEEMVLAAISKGLKSFGISDHSYTDFDTSYCMKEDVCDYISELNSLKEKYSGKIDLKCGIEMDYYSNIKTEPFDYVIGSVHYIRLKCQMPDHPDSVILHEKDGFTYIPIDETKETLIFAVEQFFDGDFYSLCESYFEAVSDCASKTKADIIGHFDLVMKFNDDCSLFDPQNERYVNAWKRTVSKLIPLKKPFEINTGAVSKGYRTFPYPAQDIIDFIRSCSGRFVFSSDAHNCNAIAGYFDDYFNLFTDALLFRIPD